MKSLNRIIFINSAMGALPYAEVNLDGNVHFIGTQGVGKSTLLRTILFFYNANKKKLGIRDGQKSYDDFYYPNSNSYIIYEVKSEQGKYCVLTFKHQNKVAFRFINSEYNKDNYIQDGKAFDSWDKIRDTFGNNVNYYRRVITSYEEYRNIIYGNNKEMDRGLRDYAIIESKQFQNIPLTISNVFLNTKLEAEFVKQTIINSLDEDKLSIDLARYNNHLNGFETNLREIQLWDEKDSRGEYKLNKLADNIIQSYKKLSRQEKDKQNYASQLGWSLNNEKTQLPICQNALTDEKSKKDQLKANLQELNTKHSDEEKELNQQIGVVKSKLDETARQSKYYQGKNIDEVLRRVGQKDSLDQQKDSLEKEMKILTDKFDDIETKYKNIFDQLETGFLKFETQKKEGKLKVKEDCINNQKSIEKQYKKIVEEYQEQNKARLESAQKAFDEVSVSYNDKNADLRVVKSKTFYTDEISKLDKEIEVLKFQIESDKKEIERKKEIHTSDQKNREYEQEKIEFKYKTQIDKLSEEKTRLNSDIAEINSKIEKINDSLFGWLNNKMPDWQDNIGKVIDEKVLFRNNLEPELLSDTTSGLFGVKINLDNIEGRAISVDDYNKEKDTLQLQVNDITDKINKQIAERDKEIDSFQKKIARKNNEYKKDMDERNYNLEQNERKLKAKQLDFEELKKKSETDKAKALEELSVEISELSQLKNSKKQELDNLQLEIKAKITDFDNEKDSKIADEENRKNKLIEEIDSSIKNSQEEYSKRKSDYEDQRKRELESNGADTEKIVDLEKRIQTIDNELKYIKDNQNLVAEYNKDKRELFDKEAEFVSKKQTLDTSLSEINKKYKEDSDKINAQIFNSDNTITKYKKRIENYNADIDKFNEFSNTDLFENLKPYFDSFSDINKNDITCGELIGSIQTSDGNYNRTYTDLQGYVNRFNGNFSDNNIFNFRNKCSTKGEYFECAETIDKFISENMINDFRKRFEARFADIISLIGKEIQQLIEKEGQIKQIIDAINNDFASRNFVGAIKSMQLRTQESSNKIYQNLVEIKKFNDDNNSVGFGGEINLFSNANTESKNKKAIELLIQLSKSIIDSKDKEISLSDSFELQFKIVENDNDSGWVDKLSSVGSEGTDILVKAMINILLINVFKERASKKNHGDFTLHCMMDEIGKLHPTNVKGILKFANDRNIYLINSSPTSTNPIDYKYTYILSKDSRNKTKVVKLISK